MFRCPLGLSIDMDLLYQLIGYCILSGIVLSNWSSQNGLGGGVGRGNTGTSITLNR